MKTIFKTLAIVLPLTFLLSCVNKEKTIKNVSPDGAIEIVINGKKTSIASPWALAINAKKDGEVNTVETEMYVEEPNNENILFNWTSNSRCTITLIEQDGTKRTIPVIIE